MKSNLKSGWIAAFTLSTIVLTVLLWIPATTVAQTLTCPSADDCVFDNACYNQGACLPNGQYCAIQNGKPFLRNPKPGECPQN